MPTILLTSKHLIKKIVLAPAIVAYLINTNVLLLSVDPNHSLKVFKLF